MRLEDKADSSSDLPIASPTLNSSSAPEDSNKLLPQEEVVLLIPEATQNVPQKKQQNFPWGAVKIFLSIFLIGYGINWIRFDFLRSIALCGGSVSAQLEGKYKTGVMNRAQQAYFLDNQKFTENFQQLDFGFTPTRSNYNYSIRTTNKAGFQYAVASADAYKLRTEYFGPFWWDIKEPLQLKSYVGAVFVVSTKNDNPTANKKEMTTIAVTCEAIKLGSITPNPPTLVKGIPTCSTGTRDFK